MLLSSIVALIGGNSTKPGSGYYALIKADFSLCKISDLLWLVQLASQLEITIATVHVAAALRLLVSRELKKKSSGSLELYGLCCTRKAAVNRAPEAGGLIQGKSQSQQQRMAKGALD